MPLVENYTTKISAAKTAAQVQELLAAHGANRVMVEYDQGHPRAVSFEILTDFGLRQFTLPVDVEAMHALLKAEKKSGRLPSISASLAQDPIHAERVAWRVVAEWLRAQMTLVASKMAPIDQVMLPYLVTDTGRTLYSAYRDQQIAVLEAGRGH